MTSRIAAARRSVTVQGIEGKTRQRVPLGRVSNSRVARPANEDRQQKVQREKTVHIPAPQMKLEPFVHTEVPIGDKLDTQDVTEYEHIIYRSLRQKEAAMPQLVFNQKEITLKDRNVLIDSLCRIHFKLGLTTNGLYRCIGILDRYLACGQVPKAKLNLYGAACLFIASKIEDIYPAQSTDLIKLFNREFTRRDLFSTEIKIINDIGFDTTFATPLFYLTQFMRISGQTKETLLLARYICEICQTHEHFYGVSPALVAALAVMVTRILKGQERWTKELAGYTTFTEEALGPHANVVREILLQRDREETRFIRKKYQSDLFLGVANIRVPSHFTIF